MHPSGKYQNDSEKGDQNSDKYENFAEFGHWLSLPQLRVKDRGQTSVVSNQRKGKAGFHVSATRSDGMPRENSLSLVSNLLLLTCVLTTQVWIRGKPSRLLPIS